VVFACWLFPTSLFATPTFVQRNSATPQSTTATVSVSFSAAETAGDLEGGCGRVERHYGDGAVGERQCWESVKSGDRADKRDGIAAVDLLRSKYSGGREYHDRDLQSS
jgi:hypothetical protein